MFAALSKEQSNQPQNILSPKAKHEERACATDQFQQKKDVQERNRVRPP